MWTVEEDEGDRDWWPRQFSFTPQNTMSSSRRRTVYRRGSDLCYTQTYAILQKQQNWKKHHIISQLIKRQRKTGAPIWRPGRRAGSQIFTSTDRTCCLADCSFIRKHSGITCVKEWVSCRKTTHPDNNQNTNTAHVSVQWRWSFIAIKGTKYNRLHLHLWFWWDVDHPKTYKIPADWSEALQNK